MWQNIEYHQMEWMASCREECFHFPLEPVRLFVGTKKMVSNTGKDIRFWAHWQLVKNIYHTCKILSNTQFECVNWVSIHWTLHNLPWLFQIWAAKQVLGVAGMMKFLAHQDGRSPICPSCQECNKMCNHITLCSEARDWEDRHIQPVHEGGQMVVRRTQDSPRSTISTPYVPPWMQYKDLHRMLKHPPAPVCLPRICNVTRYHWMGSICNGDGLNKAPS